MSAGTDDKLSRVQLHHLMAGVLRGCNWTPFYVFKIQEVFGLAEQALEQSATGDSAEALRLLRVAYEQCCGLTQTLFPEDHATFGAPSYLIEIEQFLERATPDSEAKNG